MPRRGLEGEADLLLRQRLRDPLVVPGVDEPADQAAHVLHADAPHVVEEVPRALRPAQRAEAAAPPADEPRAVLVVERAAAERVVERRRPPPVRAVGVRAHAQQERHGQDARLRRRQVQRAPRVVVPRVAADPAPVQRPHAREVPLARRRAQLHRAHLLGHRPALGPDHARQPRAPAPHRLQERGARPAVLLVGVRLLLQEELHHLGVPVGRRNVQRAARVVVPRVDVRPVVDEPPQRVHVLRARRRAQRRPRLLRVDEDLPLQQQLHHGALLRPHRLLQHRLPPPIPHVLVHPLLQQQLHDLEVALHSRLPPANPRPTTANPAPPPHTHTAFLHHTNTTLQRRSGPVEAAGKAACAGDGTSAACGAWWQGGGAKRGPGPGGRAGGWTPAAGGMC